MGAAPQAVLVLAGPTASGKSALALRLAAARDSVIINADSLQLYRALPVLTARPSAADMACTPHALYAVLDPHDACSAARWRALALEAIAAAIADGRLPIVTGGTGFYLRALLRGLSPMPEIPRAVREGLIQRQRDIGTPALYRALAERDPDTAARLDPHNTQRILRAWEVLEGTGQGLSAWQNAPPVPPPAHLRFVVTVLAPPRDALYAACDARFDRMMQDGAVEDVIAFRAVAPPVCAAEHALGCREISAYLDGVLSLSEAVAAAKQSTRHYAKRQGTWFRHQLQADVTVESADDTAAARVWGVVDAPQLLS